MYFVSKYENRRMKRVEIILRVVVKNDGRAKTK
jgi:hypothetical protein